MATLADHALRALRDAGFTAQDWCTNTLAGSSVFSCDAAHYEAGRKILAEAGFALEQYFPEPGETAYLVGAIITRT